MQVNRSPAQSEASLEIGNLVWASQVVVYHLVRKKKSGIWLWLHGLVYPGQIFSGLVLKYKMIDVREMDGRSRNSISSWKPHSLRSLTHNTALRGSPHLEPDSISILKFIHWSLWKSTIYNTSNLKRINRKYFWFSKSNYNFCNSSLINCYSHVTVSDPEHYSKLSIKVSFLEFLVMNIWLV